MQQKIGVLLTNTGTPDAPTTSAVRRYLREFLSDPRVVKIPRIIWLPILYFFILTFRPRRSAALYQKIWAANESPMRTIMQKLTTKLEHKLNADINKNIEIGMNYGNPSIKDALEKLRSAHIDKLIVLPLYPQYSNTTTASTFDRVYTALHEWPALPAITMLRDYASHPEYISALAQSVQDFWREHGQTEHLLISFHGLPKRFAEAGDPYPQQCEQTAIKLAEALNLSDHQWTLCYQSQFGYDKWLQPSTQALLTELPLKNIRNIDVICPGFSIDCLETLDEIGKRGKKDFITAGGNSLRLIPALNDSDSHVSLLNNLIQQQCGPC